VKITAVVLAAGRARRMGVQKLLLPVNGVAMLARVLDACAHLPTVAVIGEDLGDVAAAYANARAIINREPDRGMAHSLRLANDAIDPSHAVLVLLGDKPLVTRGLIGRIIDESRGVDVCFPQHAGVGGHPVALSPRARAHIAQLADGDSLQSLRDDSQLVRRAVPADDPGAYIDIDDSGDLRGVAHPSLE
jgi:molybdenum cofactor cytidylyltransferase